MHVLVRERDSRIKNRNGYKSAIATSIIVSSNVFKLGKLHDAGMCNTSGMIRESGMTSWPSTASMWLPNSVSSPGINNGEFDSFDSKVAVDGAEFGSLLDRDAWDASAGFGSLIDRGSCEGTTGSESLIDGGPCGGWEGFGSLIEGGPCKDTTECDSFIEGGPCRLCADVDCLVWRGFGDSNGGGIELLLRDSMRNDWYVADAT